MQDEPGDAFGEQRGQVGGCVGDGDAAADLARVAAGVACGGVDGGVRGAQLCRVGAGGVPAVGGAAGQLEDARVVAGEVEEQVVGRGGSAAGAVDAVVVAAVAQGAFVVDAPDGAEDVERLGEGIRFVAARG